MFLNIVNIAIQQADEMRKAVVPLRKYLGYAATQGLSELIQSE